MLDPLRIVTSALDDAYGPGYAEAHPEIVAALLLSDQLQQVVATLRSILDTLGAGIS